MGCAHALGNGQQAAPWEHETLGRAAAFARLELLGLADDDMTVISDADEVTRAGRDKNKHHLSVRERERVCVWFIQRGNRTPVSKATHSRYREGPVRPRVRR